MAKKKMTKALVELWDQRLRADLQQRMSQCDPDWEKHNVLVRNTGSGFRNGNLVEDFVRVLQMRLFARPFEVSIKPDNPDYAEKADTATVVSESVARIASLSDQLFEATKDAMWATTGWLEVGHPLDPWSLDVMRSVFSPNVDQTEMLPDNPAVDEYEPVDPSELAAYGVQPDNVLPFDPFAEIPAMEEEGEAQPVFNATMGYPWLTVVDPRLVLIPPQARNEEGVDYICRLRFMTRAELKKIRNVDYGYASGSINGEFKEIFTRSSGMDPLLFPELMLIMETWIIRDRNNPDYNNWYLCHVFGHSEWVITNTVNPYGGMIPLTPVKPLKHKGYYDASTAKTLAQFADIFDIGVKSLYHKFLELLNPKTLNGAGAGLEPKEAKKLNDPSYRGPVAVNDITQVQRWKPEPLDQAFLVHLNYVKSLAQTSSGANDMDRGQPIKDISARQTSALIQATGINVEGMKNEIAQSARKVLMKLMHLIGLYNHQSGGRTYQIEDRIVKMNRGTHDFTESFIYNVEVVDTGDTDAESQLSWNQFLRTLMTDSGGVLIPYIDLEKLARETVRIYGKGSSLLASRGAGRPGEGQLGSADPQVQAGLSGIPQLSSGQDGPLGLSDMADGQHPERQLGSRGLSMSNAMSGLKRTGISGV